SSLLAGICALADARLLIDFESGMEVGARVQVGSDKATVRYIGQVDGVRGDWVGVEWDDPSRGKHDGTVKDRRYFTTKHPTGGSLVRPNLVSLGEDLESAVSSRYGSDENADDFMLGTKRVEMVGLEKGRQRNLSALRVIVLDNMTVNGAVREGSDPLFPRCIEVNLYGNLLRRWRDVVDILAHMPRCEELVLSANFLEEIPSGSAVLEGVERHLSVLRVTLNRCRLDEGTIARCLGLFPRIEELYAASNGMCSFGRSFLLPSSLTLIDLEDNGIAAFEDIGALEELPNLAKLSLARCRLRSVRIAGPHAFPVLHTLNLKGNDISDWESIAQLRQLAALATLYVDFERFHAEFGMDPREVITAKLPSLRNLERCELSVIERRSAEIRYLNKYSALSEERKRGEQHVEDLERLEKEHGAPVLDNARAKQMAIVRISFVMGEKTLPERSLPTSLTIQKVLDMARKLFKLGREEQIVAALDQNGFLIDLEYVMRPLAFYEPQNGDLIRIHTV
ncbi:tbce-1, partial [Pristionchus pacificus]